MRISVALLAVVVVACVLPFALAEDQEPPGLSVELFRTTTPPPVGIDAGGWWVPEEGALDEVLASIRRGDGGSAQASLPGAAGSVGLLDRVSYVSDFDAEVGMGDAKVKPIRSTIAEGVILDVDSEFAPAVKAVTIRPRVTLAQLVRPIATFQTTTMSEPPLTIELPELQVTRQRKELRVPLDRTALLYVGPAAVDGGAVHFYAVFSPLPGVRKPDRAPAPGGK